MNNKRNIILIAIITILLVGLISFATYAYFGVGSFNVTNAANLNTVTEGNNMVFDTLGGAMILNVTATNMTQAGAGNVAAENNTTLTVNFQANTSYSMVCSYDIIYEWTSTDKYTSHSSGVTGWEFTIKANLASNVHVYEGDNKIKVDQDLSTLTYTNNSAVVVEGATIDSTGTSTSSAVWTLSSKIYNAAASQTAISGKTYEGRFKVSNVSCTGGEAEKLAYWYDDTTCTNSNRCTYPYGGTLQTSGTAIGQNVYIGQDNSKYHACAMIDGHEICLSQPYTQYGLDDHVVGSQFTDMQLQNAKVALEQAIADAGVTGVQCRRLIAGNSPAGISCSFSLNSSIHMSIYHGGYIMIDNFDFDNMLFYGCEVDLDGTANCYQM